MMYKIGEITIQERNFQSNIILLFSMIVVIPVKRIATCQPFEIIRAIILKQTIWSN